MMDDTVEEHKLLMQHEKSHVKESAGNVEEEDSLQEDTSHEQEQSNTDLREIIKMEKGQKVCCIVVHRLRKICSLDMKRTKLCVKYLRMTSLMVFSCIFLHSLSAIFSWIS